MDSLKTILLGVGFLLIPSFPIIAVLIGPGLVRNYRLKRIARRAGLEFRKPPFLFFKTRTEKLDPRAMEVWLSGKPTDTASMVRGASIVGNFRGKSIDITDALVMYERLSEEFLGPNLIHASTSTRCTVVNGRVHSERLSIRDISDFVFKDKEIDRGATLLSPEEIARRKFLFGRVLATIIFSIVAIAAFIGALL
jgi:hypothetical protein